jgi:plasmid stabilization system protein ParE
MKVIYTGEASEDLDGILAYIASKLRRLLAADSQDELI